MIRDGTFDISNLRPLLLRPLSSFGLSFDYLVLDESDVVSAMAVFHTALLECKNADLRELRVVLYDATVPPISSELQMANLKLIRDSRNLITLDVALDFSIFAGAELLLW